MCPDHFLLLTHYTTVVENQVLESLTAKVPVSGRGIKAEIACSCQMHKHTWMLI